MVRGASLVQLAGKEHKSTGRGHRGATFRPAGVGGHRTIHHDAITCERPVPLEIWAWIRSRLAPPWFLPAFSVSRAMVSSGVLVAGSPSWFRGRAVFRS